MVQFDLCFERDYRRASNPKLVLQSACDGLEDKLKQSDRQTAPNTRSEDAGTIVPFRAKMRPASYVQQSDVVSKLS